MEPLFLLDTGIIPSTMYGWLRAGSSCSECGLDPAATTTSNGQERSGESQMQTEERKAYMQEYHQKYDKAYRSDHRDVLLAKHREYNTTHKGEAQVYTAEHKVEQAIRSGLYYVEHREEILAQSKTYYTTHAGEYLTRKRRYAGAYPERRRLEVE